MLNLYEIRANAIVLRFFWVTFAVLHNKKAMIITVLPENANKNFCAVL